MLRPDYDGGSIVNLMASIVLARGGASAYVPLRALMPDAIASARTLVLLVVDGLGDRFLTRHGERGVLLAHRRCSMTSVFPSTTATAITTFLTAQAPSQHGLTGWHMYFRELDGVLTVLPMRPRTGAPVPAPITDASAFFGHPNVFDTVNDETYIVSPAEIVDSPFNRAHSGRAHRISYRTMEEFFNAVSTIASGGRERRFVYAYWPQLDSLAHDHGIGNERTLAHFSELEHSFGELFDAISGRDVALLITADHGFIDSTPDRTIDLEAHPRLKRMLRLPLCGERRAAYAYLHPGCHEEFERYVNETFANDIVARPAAQVLAEEYYGPGTPHPRLHERIGDYVLFMRDNAVIKDWLPGERRYAQVGVHGGMSDEELYVPLIALLP